VRRQHPERSHQDSLRLLLAYRPFAPALADRPLTDAPLQAEGTKLLREWRGVAHEVTVIDAGYEHQGRRYKSLSAVARAITGTQWSGPLFFGLRKTGSGR
jgi:Protein of unknown function (DUF2924)